MTRKNKFKRRAIHGSDHYTVVGYWCDSGQVWVRHPRAFSPEDAVVAAVKDVKARRGGIEVDFDWIAIVEVFEGNNRALGPHSHIVIANEWPGIRDPEEGN